MIVVGCVCWRGWASLTDAKHVDRACGMSTSNSLLTTVFRHVRHLESSIDSLSLSACVSAWEWDLTPCACSLFGVASRDTAYACNNILVTGSTYDNGSHGQVTVLSSAGALLYTFPDASSRATDSYDFGVLGVVAVDAAGNIYVIDRTETPASFDDTPGSSRVVVLSPTGSLLSIILDTFNGVTNNYQLHDVTAIAANSLGHDVYVADSRGFHGAEYWEGYGRVVVLDGPAASRNVSATASPSAASDDSSDALSASQVAGVAVGTIAGSVMLVAVGISIVKATAALTSFSQLPTAAMSPPSSPTPTRSSGGTGHGPGPTTTSPSHGGPVTVELQSPSSPLSPSSVPLAPPQSPTSPPPSTDPSQLLPTSTVLCALAAASADDRLQRLKWFTQTQVGLLHIPLPRPPRHRGAADQPHLLDGLLRGEERGGGPRRHDDLLPSHLRGCASAACDVRAAAGSAVREQLEG